MQSDAARDELARLFPQLRGEDTRGNELTERVTAILNRAIADGHSEASLDSEFRDHDRIKKWLTTAEYKVDCGDNQRDGPWFVVRW